MATSCVSCSGQLDTLPASHKPYFYKAATEQGAQGLVFYKHCRSAPTLQALRLLGAPLP